MRWLLHQCWQSENVNEDPSLALQHCGIAVLLDILSTRNNYRRFIHVHPQPDSRCLEMPTESLLVTAHKLIKQTKNDSRREWWHVFPVAYLLRSEWIQDGCLGLVITSSQRLGRCFVFLPGTNQGYLKSHDWVALRPLHTRYLYCFAQHARTTAKIKAERYKTQQQRV